MDSVLLCESSSAAQEVSFQVNFHNEISVILYSSSQVICEALLSCFTSHVPIIMSKVVYFSPSEVYARS